MKTTIDRDGRLLIPEEIRRQAKIEPDSELEMRVVDGRIEIQPAATRVKLVREGHLLVAVPEVEVPPLTVDEVEKTRQSIADERGQEG